MAKTPPLGSASFWEMAALAISGRLASCPSCVEFFYFQSKQNAVAFLDSCAAGGLVEKRSLLDLRGEVSSRSVPTVRQQWYDQAIYISAPVFRRKNLDAARRRIEGTKVAVYKAFRLYYEVLGANDKAINAAYVKAVEEGGLRYSDLARERLGVDQSPVARLRLIKDGYQCRIKNKYKSEHPEMSRADIEKRAAEAAAGATAEYVLGFSAADVELPPVRDHAEELEQFVIEFLGGRRDFRDFWQKEEIKLPADYRLQLLRVVSELIRHRYDTLKERGGDAGVRFVAGIKEEIGRAHEREAADGAYVEALAEVMEDLDLHVFAGRASSLVPPDCPVRQGTEVRPH